MTPGPNLQELIDTIRADAGSGDALDELAAASATVTELNETSDAALGYFVDRARATGHSWVEISAVLGVSKQAAHKRFSVSWTARPAFDRYTMRARSVVEAATAVALRLNHAYVGTEHLLLAIYSEPETVAARILLEHDITEEKAENAVAEIIPARELKPEGEPPFTPRATHVLQGAVAEALELGHNYVGTEHILLAFFRDSGGVAAKVLHKLGLDGDTARGDVVRVLDELMRQ
jgi:ClpA/ClpB-like protein